MKNTEIEMLLREALNRLESPSETIQAGALWRIVDAAGLLSMVLRDRTPRVDAAHGRPTGRGFQITYVYEQGTA